VFGVMVEVSLIVVQCVWFSVCCPPLIEEAINPAQTIPFTRNPGTRCGLDCLVCHMWLKIYGSGFMMANDS